LLAAVLPGVPGERGRRPEVGLTHCTGGGITGYDHAVRTIHILTTAR